MHAFIIELEDRPGSLAEIAAAFGDKGINISAVAGLAWGSSGAAAIVTNDDVTARSVLDERSAAYREVELVAVALEDRPGSLAEATRKLADAGINIEALVATGMQGSEITIAFGVQDPAGARAALAELAATGGSGA